jgi:hypothetical protein
MGKTLTFEYKGKTYTLEYTRRTIAMMEQNGFVPAEMTDKPMSTILPLFEGAFLAHHRKTKKGVIDEIYDHMTNKEELLSKLSEMYTEPLEALMADPEDDEGNVNWTANW